jgi:hypothetical protein
MSFVYIIFKTPNSMRKVICWLGMAVLLYGCSGNQKKASKTEKISINKVWVFKKVDTAKSNFKGTSSFWIGGNIIDMSNPDTLRYSATTMHNGTTTYPYKVSDNKIYLAGKQTYSIVKLTDSILELSAINHIKEQNGNKRDSVVVMMIYTAK